MKTDLGEALARELLADGLPDCPLDMADTLLLDLIRLMDGDTDIDEDWSKNERAEAATIATQVRATFARVRTLLQPIREKLTAGDREQTVELTPGERSEIPF